MPSRSAKSSRNSFSSFALAVLGFGFAFLSQPSAFATITVTPVNFGTSGTPIGGSQSTFYYSTATPGSGPLGNPLYYDNGTHWVGTNSRFTNDPSGGALSNALVFAVSSSNTSFAAATNQLPFLFLQLKNPTSGYSTAAPFTPLLPITGWTQPGGGPNICAGSPCTLGGSLMGPYPGPEINTPPYFNGAYNYALGLQYTVGQTYYVYIYPSDLCRALLYPSGATYPFCAAGSPAATLNPQPNAPAQIVFRAMIVNAPNDYISPIPSGNQPLDTSGDILLNIQSDIPSANCAGGTPAGALYPGDTQLQIDTSQFSLTGLTNPTLDAPATTLFVSAVPNPAAAVPNVGPTPIPMNGQSQYVGGFTNSNPSAGQNYTYDVSFQVRDASGMVVTGNGCTATGEQTFAIYGFLNKSRCFIATAAFRDTDAPPVMILRRFRDEVLERFALGRSIVHLYYRWSPDFARHLMDYPEFRYPVLLALVPFEIGAWLALNPTLAFTLAGAAFGLVAMALMIRFRRRGPEAG